jgi:hypothetical protein
MWAGALLGTMREARWAAAMTYGGHGGTLGPALVFGYRAGRDAADRSRWEAPAVVPKAGG